MVYKKEIMLVMNDECRLRISKNLLTQLLPKKHDIKFFVYVEPVQE